MKFRRVKWCFSWSCEFLSSSFRGLLDDIAIIKTLFCGSTPLVMLAWTLLDLKLSYVWHLICIIDLSFCQDHLNLLFPLARYLIALIVLSYYEASNIRKSNVISDVIHSSTLNPTKVHTSITKGVLKNQLNKVLKIAISTSKPLKLEDKKSQLQPKHSLYSSKLHAENAQRLRRHMRTSRSKARPFQLLEST
jgi:hypothetical protein